MAIRTLVASPTVYRVPDEVPTLTVGITPDNSGLIPNADVQRLSEWGDSVKKVFKAPIATFKPQQKDLTINIPIGKSFSKIVLQENIREGERVRSFVVEANINGEWKTIKEGTCIGHKFIGLLEKPITASSVRLKILISTADPLIQTFALY